MPTLKSGDRIFTAAEIREIYGLPASLVPDQLTVGIEVLDVNRNIIHRSIQLARFAGP